MTRTRAALIHLAICILIAGLALSMLLLVWYPDHLASALGADTLFFVLIGVDLVIGPLLTFVLYVPGKRGLRLDLSIIAVLQTVALAYGLSVLAEGRPVFIVSLGHRFDVIQPDDISAENLAKATIQPPWWGPKWFGIRMSDDPKVREKLLFDSLSGSVDYGQMPEYYAPLETMRDKNLKSAQSIENLRLLNPGQKIQIDAWLKDHNHTDKTAVYQGLRARKQDMAVILDKSSGELVGIAPFNPWK